MANLQTSQNGIEQITVDTAPGVDGYWTEPVLMRKGNDEDIRKLYFSVREKTDGGASVVIPTLQFKGINDLGWTDYNNEEGTAFVIGDCKVMDANALFVAWRAGVKYNEYTSGSINMGFAW